MKFLFVTGHYFPHIGGVEKYTRELVHQLTLRGHESRVVTTQFPGYKPSEHIDHVLVERIPSYTFFGGEFPIYKSGQRLNKILRDLEQWRPDVVVTNTRYFSIHLPFIKYARQHKIEHFHIEHGSDDPAVPWKILAPLSRIYDYLLGGKVIRNAKHYAGVSMAVNKFVQRRFHRASKYILYNAVNTGVDIQSPTSLREKLHIPTSAIVVGYAGRLIPEKGILLLTNTLRSLRSKNIEIYVLIAGTGALAAQIQKEAHGNDRIVYLGSLSAEEMLNFYSTIDIFCLPTSYPEGFPTVLLEAGLFGKYIITTNRGSAEEIIQSETDGLIIPERNEDALQAALTKAITIIHPGELREGLRRKILQKFTWQKTADNFLAALSDEDA